MNKLILAKHFSLSYLVNLEQTIQMNQNTKQTKIGKGAKKLDT